jgi:hypothetical protein
MAEVEDGLGAFDSKAKLGKQPGSSALVKRFARWIGRLVSTIWPQMVASRVIGL